MNSFRLILITLFISILVFKSTAQETLQAKYVNMLETTETYEQYKVIPRTTLNAFWSEVSDSLSQNSRTINELTLNIAGEKAKAIAAEASMNETQAQLEESLNKNDSISFLKISFSKTGYHLLVWLIILVLAVLGAIAYLMFVRSNKVTIRVRQDHDELLKEFDAHKDKAREAQVKLKRELQTALNQLNERR